MAICEYGTFVLQRRRLEGGRGFSDEDEETLVLFASQAATAIANAQAYRDERRTRADLEAPRGHSGLRGQPIAVKR